MSYSIRSGCLVALLALVLVNVASGQDTQRNPTTYPYGCVEDETLSEDFGPIPLRCTAGNFRRTTFDSAAVFPRAEFDSVSFDVARFDSRADFREATFAGWARFRDAKFTQMADFSFATFDSRADFRSTKFDSGADFSSTKFASRAVFSGARFDSVSFAGARFNSLANFLSATFASEADFDEVRFDSVGFRRATFDTRASFQSARFNSPAYFGYAKFSRVADFTGSRFEGSAVFSRASFDSLAYFVGASFWDAADFRNAQFDPTGIADFTRAAVRDTVWIGTWVPDAVQRFNFRRVNFLQSGREVRPSDSIEIAYPGAAVVLHGLADLQFQVEKIDVLHLADSLSYFDKKDIITFLKDNSFNEDDQKVARFELDYLLARSTMHQRPTGRYKEYPWYHPRLWWNYLYYYLMGFGYRPFWIFLWAGGMVLLFGGYYRWAMPHQTLAYVQNDPQGESANPDDSAHPQLLTPWIHSLYFSTMVFFTFRLKRRILTFFAAREQRIIVAQWVLGFLIYVAFLTLAKSGSILHQLKVLFVGEGASTITRVIVHPCGRTNASSNE